MLMVGFDPGGRKQFGWCVLEGTGDLPLGLLNSGVVDSAADALAAAKAVVGLRCPEAVGIDSPLFWVPKGDRRADSVVREAVKRAGSKHAGGTVQQVNSLRGACIAQGVLAAHLSRASWPTVRITESHPKALLWLLAVASKGRPPTAVSMVHLGQFIRSQVSRLGEHERDAALGGFAAWAMLAMRDGWRNLATCEKDAFMPVPVVEYWMPAEAVEQPNAPDERRMGRGSATRR